MSRIIAIANHKGGVGKTTTAANIGAELASRGYSVLLIDLDAQANLTTSFINEEPELNTYTALKGRKALPIMKINENLYIAPASLDLAGIELELASAMSREYILQELIELEGGRFDFVLLDCAPSLGLLTINAFTAADRVIIPTTAEALPSKGLQKIIQLIELVRTRINPNLQLLGIVITRYIKKNLSAMVEEQLREQYGSTVLKTKIRENVSIAEAPLFHKDVIGYAPTSHGAEDYKELTEELLEKIK